MADKLVAKTQLEYFKGKLDAKNDEKYVAKEAGKVLSTNDFTNAYKTKLDGIEAGANKTVVDESLNKESTNPVQNKAIATKLEEITSQGGEPNTIETIKVNGSPLEPDGSKAVDISVPTKVSQLQNDSGYQTAANVEQTLTSKNYATKSDISSVYKYKGSVETYGELPQSEQQIGDVYNVETADSSHGVKAGDNVAWNGTAWVVLSGTVDLSNYYDMTNYPLCQNSDIDEMFA
ncbi:hypothetical protein PND93_02640 [Faecalicoccus pleomorphus]|uniref:hypothetical protein n=1 Tax=Faecalicoccus pleomorphus TaxID=1323 RepID=UPI00232D819D|nr:hypothetical protein [Faecalicoccus pleomorphus]MDB7990482.1 hypothetical protein [Faecalicoccus pleomorphus]